jgi:hypothetical protein
MAPNTLPAMAKSTANYANSALIKMEALADGYAEGIALDPHDEGRCLNFLQVFHIQTIRLAPTATYVLKMRIDLDALRQGRSHELAQRQQLDTAGSTQLVRRARHSSCGAAGNQARRGIHAE